MPRLSLPVRRTGAFAVLALLLSIGPARASNEAREQDLKAQAAVRYLERLMPGVTVKRIQKMTPRDTVLGRPKWETTEIAQGNYVRISGKMEGILIFLGNKARRILRARHPETLTAADKIGQPADSLDLAMLNVGPSRDKRTTLQVIQLVSRRLGQPKTKRFEKEAGPDSGWQAVWEIPNGRTVTLEEDSDIHLYLSFRYSVRP